MKYFYAILAVLLIQMSFAATAEARGNSDGSRASEQGMTSSEGAASGTSGPMREKAHERMGTMREHATSDGSVSRQEAKRMSGARSTVKDRASSRR